MKPANILVTDDEQNARMALCEALTLVGHHADSAGSAGEALNKLKKNQYDVVLLDLRMPGPEPEGMEVLTQAETVAPDTSFIILTAHATTETAIDALRHRAFDYLLKPVRLNEILDTVEKALASQARAKALKGGVVIVSGVSLNLKSEAAWLGSEPLSLTPVEYKLLEALILHADTVFSYTQLATFSHYAELAEEEARTLLRTHLFRLSRKLGDKDSSPLQAVRGRGYIFRSTPVHVTGIAKETVVPRLGAE